VKDFGFSNWHDHSFDGDALYPSYLRAIKRKLHFFSATIEGTLADPDDRYLMQASINQDNNGTKLKKKYFPI
jgi:hypothetical protein